MNVTSTYRFARISAFKAREVTREIQGLPANQAMDLLKFVPKKAAVLVRKTLASAIANAENNNNIRAEELTIREAVVGEGPTFKRFQPKARGSAGPIRKRTSHIRIVVTDEIPIEGEEKSKAKKTSSSKKSSRSKSTAQSISKSANAQDVPASQPPTGEGTAPSA